MRFSVYISIYLSYLIKWINAQTDIDVWYEPMNIDPTTSSWTLNTQTNTLLSDTVCPNTNDYCWVLQPSLLYYRESDTTQFVSVQLTYSIDAASINEQDYCLIEYSLDGTNFVDIKRINSGSANTTAIAETYSAWSAAGISALRIQISASGAGNACYFNEFRLWGTPITPQPTNTPSGTPFAPPTDAPSGAPTAAPTELTTAPSISPTIEPTVDPITMSPTADPTADPTSAAPSKATSLPTSAPTTSPSAAPSIAPSNPTLFPTITPTIPTSQPTSAPTYRYYCADRYCYDRSITPVAGELVSQSVNIQDSRTGIDTYFDFNLYIAGAEDCYRPSVDFSFERIDNDSGSEYLYLQYENSYIATCYKPNLCGTFHVCAADLSLGSGTTITAGNTITITVVRSYGVDALCTSYHSYSINAVLSVSCNEDPIPTLDPTRSSAAPTELTTSPSTAAPTGLTTSSPSAAPTEPTVLTSNPTPNPTLKTLSCAYATTCYSVDVVPIANELISTPIVIQAAGSSLAVYDVTFNIWGSVSCNRPWIEFKFEAIDNDSGSEYLTVIDASTGTQIGYCGRSSNLCGSFTDCAISTINNGLDIDTNATYRVQRPSVVDAYCYSHGLTINAVLTLYCDDRTISPTADPTTSPTAAPSDSTLDPTIAPSSAPTTPPSAAPSKVTSLPTSAPTASPSAAPSIAPTHNTSNPTLFPTITPTIPTSQPTSAPTYRYYCADRYCYDRSITPVAGELVSQSVNIQDSRSGIDTYFDLNLYVAGAVDCNLPTVDFSYEPTDGADGSWEYLYLQYESSNIATCSYPNTACNTFYACVTDLSLGSGTTITAGNTITITVVRSYAVDALCTPSNMYSINAVLSVSCNDSITIPTLDPSQSPTNPPTMQKCSRTDPTATVCYQTYVASSYTYATRTFSTSIYRYDGNNPDIYDIYYTASSPCYNPYISVLYQYVDSYNGIIVLDANGNQLGNCSGAIVCGTRSYCMQDYNLGMEVLETSNSYIVTLFGRYLTNGCSSSVTTDAIVYFICDMIPTTIISPSGAPTQPISDPTSDPTLVDVKDGGGEFNFYILSNLLCVCVYLHIY